MSPQGNRHEAVGEPRLRPPRPIWNTKTADVRPAEILAGVLREPFPVFLALATAAKVARATSRRPRPSRAGSRPSPAPANAGADHRSRTHGRAGGRAPPRTGSDGRAAVPSAAIAARWALGSRNIRGRAPPRLPRAPAGGPRTAGEGATRHARSLTGEPSLRRKRPTSAVAPSRDCSSHAVQRTRPAVSSSRGTEIEKEHCYARGLVCTDGTLVMAGCHMRHPAGCCADRHSGPPRLVCSAACKALAKPYSAQPGPVWRGRQQRPAFQPFLINAAAGPCAAGALSLLACNARRPGMRRVQRARGATINAMVRPLSRVRDRVSLLASSRALEMRSPKHEHKVRAHKVLIRQRQEAPAQHLGI